MRTHSYARTHPSLSAEKSSASAPIRVCMLFIEAPARSEARLMRDAIALVNAGFEVTIIDVERDRTRPVEEVLEGAHLTHIFLSSWYTPTRFKPWFLLKLAHVYLLCLLRLLKTPADLYHVHVEKAFPACYLAARLRRKPLIFDSPDLPFSDPHLTRWRLLANISQRLMRRMVPGCAAIITASPLYAQEIYSDLSPPGGHRHSQRSRLPAGQQERSPAPASAPGPRRAPRALPGQYPTRS